MVNNHALKHFLWIIPETEVFGLRPKLLGVYQVYLLVVMEKGRESVRQQLAMSDGWINEDT
jgi:hypothetical protein